MRDDPFLTYYKLSKLSENKCPLLHFRQSVWVIMTKKQRGKDMTAIEKTITEYIYDQIAYLGNIVSREASVFSELIDFVQDSDNISKRISFLESDADIITHQVKLCFKEEEDLKRNEYMVQLLNILNLAEQCTDVMEDLAVAFNSFNISSIRDSYIPIAARVEEVSTSVETLLASIRSMDDITVTQNALISVNHAQEEASSQISIAMRELFSIEKDPIEIIRWKEILLITQRVFDNFEDLADKIEEMLLLR